MVLLAKTILASLVISDVCGQSIVAALVWSVEEVRLGSSAPILMPHKEFVLSSLDTSIYNSSGFLIMRYCATIYVSLQKKLLGRSFKQHDVVIVIYKN